MYIGRKTTEVANYRKSNFEYMNEKTQKKTSSPSLYLSQSYQDAWSDYQRSLKSTTFPMWDYIILTASNEHQAESFRLQIESRREYLPARTEIGIRVTK